MKTILMHPNMYSSSPNTYQWVRKQVEGMGHPAALRTLTGIELITITRIRKIDIHTALSTSSPIFQLRNVLPSSYRNLIVLETATSSSAAKIQYANLSFLVRNYRVTWPCGMLTSTSIQLQIQRLDLEIAVGIQRLAHWQASMRSSHKDMRWPMRSQCPWLYSTKLLHLVQRLQETYQIQEKGLKRTPVSSVDICSMNNEKYTISDCSACILVSA